jgi:branched-chain amino acid transport system substrate-binding protein
LSTPAGYIGEDERDAFMLAVKEGGGKLGGVPVQRARSRTTR